MLAPLSLLAFAVLAATAGPRLLLRARWVHRAPGWGVLAWQGLAGSVVVAVALLGVTLAVPLPPVAAGLSRLTGIPTTTVVAHYLPPAGPEVAALAALACLGLALRLAWLAVAAVLGTVRARRGQHDGLRLLGREHPDGYVVLDHATPLVYCLPGRHPRIVVTSAARAALTPHELAQVLDHERRHLSSRHDLALAVGGVLRRAFAPVPLLRTLLATAHEQVAVLVEMQADDAARDPRGLARALVALACGAPAAPPSGLAAGDVAALARVRRLTGGAAGWSHPRSAAVGSGTAAVLAVPVVLAAAPLIEMVLIGCRAMLA
ncbi:M48 family metalloprotease [Pimelobacter simplex]|uniref:M56 family metallopeptidase n=1 Tax=Nocardioides simplex TaxID=2045 RepID=UPI001EFAC013|nr:M56 family metallopeptidase [Pimelobacter simplex]MCG8152348.1 M48 family metalloprotease [Pimelobacter simplex]